MSRICSLLVVLLAGIALQACGKSVPTRYYTLLTEAEPVTVDRLPGTTLRIAHVAVPQYLERESVVVRREGRVQLDVDSVHLWAEPLRDGIRRILHRELSSVLLQRGVNVLPLSSEESGDYTLLVDILHLEGESGHTARLSAQWSLVASRSNRVLEDGIFTEKEDIRSDSYEDMVLAESRLTRALSEHIEERISKVFSHK